MCRQTDSQIEQLFQSHANNYYSPSQLSEHEFVVEQLIIGVLIRGEVRDRLQTPESNVAMTTIPERGEAEQAEGELKSSHNFISLQVR